MEYTHNQPNEVQLPNNLNAKSFHWGLFGVNWVKSNAAQILVSVQIDINGAKNVREFTIPTPASWDEASINKELIKLPEFKGSTAL